MKTNIAKALWSGFILAFFLCLATASNAQTRKLPDGSVVYSNGTRQLPNGTVIYKGGNTGNNAGTVRLPDGRVVYQDGNRRYPNDRRNNNYNGRGLPPGQAKKIYGGSARDYAPGQQKKWKHDDDDHDRDHERDGGRGHGKHD